MSVGISIGHCLAAGGVRKRVRCGKISRRMERLNTKEVVGGAERLEKRRGPEWKVEEGTIDQQGMR